MISTYFSGILVGNGSRLRVRILESSKWTMSMYRNEFSPHLLRFFFFFTFEINPEIKQGGGSNGKMDTLNNCL